MRQRGFTSVEVLAATALAALLMAAVLGVVAGMARHERIASATPPPRWLDRCNSLLRQDLASASEVRVSTSERLAVVTTSSHRGMGGGPSWLPVQVDYFIAQRDDVTCLMRQERPLTLPGQLGAAEVVAIDVSSIHALTTLSGDPQAVVARGEIVPAGRMPRQLRVCMFDATTHVASEEPQVIVDAVYATP